MIGDGVRFLVLGRENHLYYSTVFPHLAHGEVWWGHNRVSRFSNTSARIINCGWITNIGEQPRRPPLALTGMAGFPT